MKRLLILLLLDFIFSIQVTYSQSYSFRHYQVDDGLSYNTVFCSIQDHNGFMWFGTRDGLNRFDGYNFKVFKHNPLDSNSLGSNYIYSLSEDGNGRLWIGTASGLYSYNIDEEKFKLLPLTINKSVRNLKFDNRGYLWFTVNSVLYCYSLRTKTCRIFPSNKYGLITSLTLTNKNELWVATQEGLIAKYEHRFNQFIKYDVFSNIKRIGPKHIETICYAGSGSILVGTSNEGLKLFDISTCKWKDILLYNQDGTEIFARTILHESGANFWIGTETGVFIYNLTTQKYLRLKKDFKNPYSISDNAIYTLFKDKEGGIWVGTFFGGLSYYSSQNAKFEKFYPGSADNTLSGNLVREFCQDKNGQIWIGTEDNGLNKFDPKTNSFLCLVPDGKKNSLSYNNIHGICAVGDSLWVGTYQHGMDVININSNKVLKHYGYGNRPGDLKSGYVNKIYHTQEGNILIGTMSGLFQYIPLNDTFKRVSYVPENALVYGILEDEKKTIWVATLGKGIYFYNEATQKSGHYLADSRNAFGLSSNYITSVFMDHEHEVWFTTENGGLYQHLSEKGFVKYDLHDGENELYLFDMLEDNSNYLWVASSNGLIRLNKRDKSFSIFKKEDGLLSNQFNYNSSFNDKNGNLYFGSLKGFIRFNPSKLEEPQVKHVVFITNFLIDNQDVIISENNSPFKKSVITTKEIKLSDDKSSFSIAFASPNYAAPKTVIYEYILEKFDKKWTSLSTNRKIFYTKVPPGHYILKIKAISKTNHWSTAETILNIEILPPFYASFWAYIGYAISFASIAIIIFNTNKNRLQKRHKKREELIEQEKEKEIYEAKIDFFTQITHEIRTPLTLIRGPLEKAIAVNKEKRVDGYLNLMQENTDRLLLLADQLLDFRQSETSKYKLNFRKVNINSLLRSKYALFKESTITNSLIFNLSMPDDDLYAFVDMEAINKIISNLLSNAVKYALNRIIIELIASKEYFYIKIKNDGHIISKADREKIFDIFYRLAETNNKPGTGIGLPIARALAQMHTGTLELSFEHPEFNTFLLTMPVHQTEEFDLDFEAGANEKGNIDTHNIEPINTDQSILIIDDNKDILEFISDDLKSEYCVFQSSSGTQAFEILEKNSINLIVTDLIMPNMDGFELCQRLKTDLNYSHIPIILLTASPDERNKLVSLESGADAYIQKPFSPELLKLQISNLLKSRNSLKEYYFNSPLVKLKSIAHSKADEIFLQKLSDIINTNIGNPHLDVVFLADSFNMSKPTFFRKIKAVSNVTPNELINITRLKKAAELLIDGNLKVFEIADQVGFSSSSTFVRSFQKQFRMTPKTYAQSYRSNARPSFPE